jgi:hypothetical protein
MEKNELLMLTDEQVEKIVAACDLIPPLPRPCPEVTTLACGEEGPICSAC